MGEENTGVYGRAPHAAGAQAAHDMATGKITKEQLIEQYKQHKLGPEGAADDFRHGYGEGANEVFEGH